MCVGQGEGVRDPEKVRGRQDRGCRHWSVLAPISGGFFLSFLIAAMTTDLQQSGFHSTN